MISNFTVLGCFGVDQEKEALKKDEGVADDEGWIKVTRLSKNKAVTQRSQLHDKRTKRKLKKHNREKVQRLIILC